MASNDVFTADKTEIGERESFSIRRTGWETWDASLPWDSISDCFTVLVTALNSPTPSITRGDIFQAKNVQGTQLQTTLQWLDTEGSEYLLSVLKDDLPFLVSVLLELADFEGTPLDLDTSSYAQRHFAENVLKTLYGPSPDGTGTVIDEAVQGVFGDPESGVYQIVESIADQAAQEAVDGAVEPLQLQLTTLDGRVDSLDALTTAGRLSDASITAKISGAVTPVQNSVDALAGRVTDTEGDIDTLDNRLDTAEPEIDALQSLVGSGRLSSSTLDTRFNAKVDKTALDTSVNGLLVPGTATRTTLDSLYTGTEDEGISPLAYFHGRIGNRSSQPCNIMFMGDSISTEYGASAAGRGFGPQTVQNLRSLYPIDSQTGWGLTSTFETGGYGFVPGRPTGTMMDWFVNNGWLTYTEGWEATTYGWAQSGIQLVGATGGAGVSSVTFKWLGTGVDLYFNSGSTSNSVWLSVDDGAETSLVMDPGNQQVHRVSGLSRGIHSIKVRGRFGRCQLAGFMALNNDTDWGIRYVNAARSGTKALDFAPDASTGWLRHWETLSPSLVVIAFGTNDVSNSAATFESSLRAIAQAIRTRTSRVPVVFAMMFRRYDRTEAQWAPYRAAMKQVQEETTFSMFVDFGDRFPDGATANQVQYDLMADNLHPNTAGHGVLAQYLASRIAPRG